MKPLFPCLETEVVSRPGMSDACIHTRNFGPDKLPLDHTAEQMIMQCMGRYPVESWIVFKRLTPVPRKRSGTKVIREAAVKEEWVLQLCTEKGWSKGAVLENGEEVRATEFNLYFIKQHIS